MSDPLTDRLESENNMGEHINKDGKFQSDKYPDCPAGKVPLSTKDPMAQDLLYEFAERMESKDPIFSGDLKTCLKKDGHSIVPKNQAPIIVCLTGSTKFKREYDQANKDFTMQGIIILTVGWLTHSGGSEVTEEEKARLDELHLRKIDIANYIFVINKDGYIGSSTRSEIEYAKSISKPIMYLENIKTENGETL